jgi:capsular exopolysaccharide synthesis family protein
VVLAQGADRRLRDPLELEQITDGPLLSVVPAAAFGNERIGPVGEEAFQTLRASLTYFNIDQPISSVLISSPAQGDGKTTVATNLAIAMARAGKDVILVDADLRRPRVTQRLHLDQTAGLGGVLINEVELDAALVDAEDDESFGAGRLRVLPSGDPPPNPSALLASQRMKSLVEQLTTMSDLVIIDSTPLLVVSDSLPLVEFVSGVVAVARINKTTTDAVNRFERVIVNAGGTLLGTVASGVTGTDAYGYGYGGYVLSDGPPDGGSRLQRLRALFGRKERAAAPKKKIGARKNIEPTTPEAP